MLEGHKGYLSEKVQYQTCTEAREQPQTGNEGKRTVYNTAEDRFASVSVGA